MSSDEPITPEFVGGIEAILEDDAVVEPILSEVTDAESGPPEYEISTYPADFTLVGLHQQWLGGDIFIPDFQRQFVWKQPQASRLVESFLLGLPVPPVYFYTERASERFLVIDGQQRLRSMFYFFEGFFGPEAKGRRPVFRLTGLNEKSRYANKSFDDLKTSDEASARRLQNSVLRAFVVKQLDPADDTSVYHIFERLNTGGMRLVGQEIRNAIYHGPFNNRLNTMNLDPKWREIFGRSEPDARMRDVELILRFLALNENPIAYEPPMKDFLSRFMSRQRQSSPEVLELFDETFRRTAALVRAALGPRPFHIRAGLNAAVFDSVFVALARRGTTPSDGLKERYAQLIRDPNFTDVTSLATTNVDTVRRRIAMAGEALAP